ncbi:hypothetical protein [Chromobacterium sp. IIBBL 290-4]|uniref:hypothetical protein n=1 Tax=Chromobacterium sp. IIBBL 290-4 TaxID=2953890 RepID=UPI0020B65B80|nr:hypothetical protein [Chromobacterium sp. IIBBL 290-4]UTH76013.1 hypothetical protein NKT35_07875 [Chromobacterium sp. IIBBL 290-4]
MQDPIQPSSTPSQTFRDGNPSTGELGSIVSADWLNSMQTGMQTTQSALQSAQQELVSVIQSSGQKTDPSRQDQLLQAVRNIAWGSSQRPTTLAGYGINDGASKTDLQTAINNLIAGAPGALNTLQELAAALGNDASFASSIAKLLAGKADKAGTLAGYGISNAMTRLTQDMPLPTQDIGPIWHDGYNSVMTWQIFNANGANYTGYASTLIGSLLLDTQPTARPGYIKCGPQKLLATGKYAALRAWAIHNGLMVVPGKWMAGSISFTDNDDNTFFAYDVRGEFQRCWDDGRNVDVNRPFGTWADSDIALHQHGLGSKVISAGTIGAADVAGGAGSGWGQTAPYGGNETKPRSVALLASIKY